MTRPSIASPLLATLAAVCAACVIAIVAPDAHAGAPSKEQLLELTPKEIGNWKAVGEARATVRDSGDFQLTRKYELEQAHVTVTAVGSKSHSKTKLAAKKKVFGVQGCAADEVELGDYVAETYECSKGPRETLTTFLLLEKRVFLTIAAIAPNGKLNSDEVKAFTAALNIGGFAAIGLQTFP